MTPRFTLALIFVFAGLTGGLHARQVRESAQPPEAQSASPATPSQAAGMAVYLRDLSSLDFHTRMNAARLIRRMSSRDAVPQLIAAAKTHPDEFVRYRALVLLTGFEDRRTPEVMRGLIADHNDRVREVAYKWLEQHPDRALTTTLLASLQTEQAEFVRPALVGALAALGSDPQVQRALVAESGRGLDFFRVAVIEALGRHRASYATEKIASMTMLDGPLQDDAVLALGRIGGTQSREALAALASVPADVGPAVRASACLLDGGTCAADVTTLSEAVASPRATPPVVNAGISALGVVAADGSDDEARGAAMQALASLAGRPEFRAHATVAFATVAVRQPARVIAWLGTQPAAERDAAIGILTRGFESLEEDYGEEQFFAAARAAYWAAGEGTTGRALAAALIDRLGF